MPEIDIVGKSPSSTPSNSPLNSPGDYSKGPLSRTDVAALQVNNQKQINALQDQEFKKAYALGAWQVGNEKYIKRMQDQEFSKAYALGRWEVSNERYIAQQKARVIRDQERADKKADNVKAKQFRDDYALATYMNRQMDSGKGGSGGGGWSSALKGGSKSFYKGGGLVNSAHSAVRDALEGIPIIGGLILGGIDLGRDLATGPQEIAGIANSLVNAAAPNWNLRRASANLGRAGGYSGDSLVNSLIDPDARNKAWMQRYGADPADIPGLLSNYGNGRITSSSQGITAAKDFYSLSYSKSIGGMDPSAYAQLAGQGATLFGGNGQQMIQGAGQSMDSGFFGRYFRKLQQVTEVATKYGVDQSTALNTMSSLMQNAASSGSANINQSGLADFYARLLGSGDANMRSGAGVLQMQAGLQGAIDSAGIGGNMNSTMAVQYGINKAGGLKAIGKNMNTLASFFGIDSSKMTNEQKALLQNALGAAQSGNMYEFISLARPLISTPQMNKFAGGYASTYGMSSGMTSLAAANIGNVSYQSYVDSQTPYGGLPAAIGFGGGNASDKVQIATMLAATKTGVPSSLLMGLFGVESTYGKHLYNKGSQAAGLGQITPGTFAWLQSKGKIDKDISYNDLLTDPNKSALASAEVLKYYLDTNKGNVTQALLGYGGWKDKNGNITNQAGAQSYVSRIEGEASNGLDDVNGPTYTAAQLTQKGAKQAGGIANSVLGGSNGDVVINFSTSVSSFDNAVTKFMGAVNDFVHGKNNNPALATKNVPIMPGHHNNMGSYGGFDLPNPFKRVP